MRKSAPITAQIACLSLLMSPLSLCIAEPNQPPRLTDGMPFSVKGNLQIKFEGWAAHLILPLDRRYLAQFGEGEGENYVTAIELHSEGNWQLLTEHVGEVVEARGKLQLEGVSPYYWNGVMLMADWVKLENGTTVRPQAYKPPVLPFAVKRYLVTVTMLPLHAYWPREAIDLDTGKGLPDANLDGCALNGGGDVLNCSCVDGFAPIGAGVVSHPNRPSNWQLLPKPDLLDSDMAQFGLPDADAKGTQMYQVVCERRRTPSR